MLLISPLRLTIEQPLLSSQGGMPTELTRDPDWVGIPNNNSDLTWSLTLISPNTI
jgi:hypothetical protein